MISPLAVAYRSWLVINERRARKKSKAIKPRCALLTNYPPRIVIASLCQPPRASLARSICIPTFVLQKPYCLFLTRVPTKPGCFIVRPSLSRYPVAQSVFILQIALRDAECRAGSDETGTKIHLNEVTGRHARTYTSNFFASDLIDAIDLFPRFTRNWNVSLVRIAFLFGLIQQTSFTIQSSSVVR